MSKKNKLLEEKGIVVADAIVALVIILLFSGLIISLITRVTIETKKVKIYSQQMDYVTDIFEYIEQLPYEEVNESNLISYVNNKNLDVVKAASDLSDVPATAAYKIAINIENYNETEGNTEKLDYIKIIKVTVKSTLAGREYLTEMSRIKKIDLD